jgi:hypothetical protein
MSPDEIEIVRNQVDIDYDSDNPDIDPSVAIETIARLIDTIDELKERTEEDVVTEESPVETEAAEELEEAGSVSAQS